VSVIKGRKVAIAIVDTTTKLPPIAACEVSWKNVEARAHANTTSVAAAERLESQGEAAYQKCWAERASGELGFATVTQQAQALVDALAAP
jgi:hypothetical protein